MVENSTSKTKRYAQYIYFTKLWSHNYNKHCPKPYSGRAHYLVIEKVEGSTPKIGSFFQVSRTETKILLPNAVTIPQS